ncbi:DUF2156 domain-containing protein [Desulfatirhabdium butyrativorans]|uniref:DUF2156 domain-containing protein n=1 Tax=Desulfatirhabdium butyrativorans TaxID=340467 RepID=UPI0004034832|nr:phosphatidylglycerol lysyltransferase domain-containing protein [Desulfatirhabdium butyrativorans]
MIPFSPIFPEDYDRLVLFFRRQPYDLCIYSLPSLLSWTTAAYHPCAAVIDDMLIVSAEFTKDPSKNHLILPICLDRELTPDALRELASETGYPGFWFVPENYIERHGKTVCEKNFDVIPQPEYEDYVYARDDLAFLKGRKYAKKRNLIAQFQKAYVQTGKIAIEPVETVSTSESIAFLELWCEERNCRSYTSDDLECEKQALINMLSHIQRYDVKGLVLRIEGEVAALGIAAGLTKEMGVLHFEKAFARYKGLYQFFDRHCAEHLFDGFSWINKESDMGLANLAKAKKSYYPAFRVPSYEFRLR